MDYHVAKNGSDQATGNDPFLTINKAASLAIQGIITKKEVVYREWVKPKYKGLSDSITYQAAEGKALLSRVRKRLKINCRR